MGSLFSSVEVVEVLRFVISQLGSLGGRMRPRGSSGGRTGLWPMLTVG
jgi:hypothetical protein